MTESRKQDISRAGNNPNRAGLLFVGGIFWRFSIVPLEGFIEGIGTVETAGFGYLCYVLPRLRQQGVSQ